MNRNRGQALLETTLAMPLFLLGLFGVMWAARAGAMGERAQLGVRYGGEIGAAANPYTNYSLYTVYAAMDRSLPSPSSADCEAAMMVTATGGRRAFWSPAPGTTPTASCLPSALVALSPGAENFSQTVFVESDRSVFSAAAAVDGYLQRSVLGASSTSTTAMQNFIRSPNVGHLAQCTPLGDALKASLEPSTAALSDPPLYPQAMSSSLPDTPLSPNAGGCEAFTAPAPSSAPPAAPTPVPSARPDPVAKFRGGG